MAIRDRIENLKDKQMKITIILKIVGILYRYKLRDLLIKYIDDPDNKWDDALIKALDEFFVR